MSPYVDGPASPLFHPVKLKNMRAPAEVLTADDCDELRRGVEAMPLGDCVYRGIPVSVDGVLRVGSEPVSLEVEAFQARWLVFLHTTDRPALQRNKDGFFSPMKGVGLLGETAGAYTIRYEDGGVETIALRRRHEISAFSLRWGENPVEAVPCISPSTVRPHHEQTLERGEAWTPSWGVSQTRVQYAGRIAWTPQLYAWQNPHPGSRITAVTCTVDGPDIFICGLTAGSTDVHPLRWERRRKALIRIDRVLGPGERWDPSFDEHGRLSQIGIDLGQIISATERRIYPDDEWESGHNNMQPELDETAILIEYTAHPEARLHFTSAEAVPVSELADEDPAADGLRIGAGTAPAEHRIRIRVVERHGSVPVPVKFHAHGAAGEYLAPVDRHRIPNEAWFEDYSVDFVHLPVEGAVGPGDRPLAPHYCTYIPGAAVVDVPIGKIFIEVSKGYEICPVRRVFDVSPQTEEITIELDRVLDWRSRGWVSADTHVHFLSPVTALIEGSAEGVNVVNLLASQWGELMTNVGDFDGRTTWGSREAGGDGEFLVRVGTENRQHVLGHISLLGYEGRIIAPMTTGGPNESALGDSVETLLSEWATQCRRQNGVVIIPHFPNPRLENAAVIVGELADGVEMTSWGNLFGGIDPYSLSDWYRFLNCGYQVAAVGGTDKMSAATAVGTSRTYTRLPDGVEFTFDAWRNAIRSGETFVTYGPLLDFSVSGVPMGGSLALPPRGGAVDVEWEVASVTVPVSEVDLIVNGEVVERVAVSDGDALTHGRESLKGSWRISLTESSWLALLVRGHYPGKPEIIAAHSSAVTALVDGSELYVERDAVSILEQIEGTLAYVDTVGTRAQTAAYKRMRLVIESVHRELHNRMHRLGYYHEHTVGEDHAEHRTRPG